MGQKVHKQQKNTSTYRSPIPLNTTCWLQVQGFKFQRQAKYQWKAHARRSLKNSFKMGVATCINMFFWTPGKPIPSSSSSLYIWNQRSIVIYLIKWRTPGGQRFQIYRELVSIKVWQSTEFSEKKNETFSSWWLVPHPHLKNMRSRQIGALFPQGLGWKFPKILELPPTQFWNGFSKIWWSKPRFR